MKKKLESRLNVLVTIIVVVFMVFGLKLMQYQIIDGEYYYEKSNTSIRFKQSITAARGDIVDRYGTPIASSELVFNVVLNKAYLDSKDTNQRIIDVAKILNDKNEEINDLLPLSENYPYTFKKDKEAEISRVKKTLALNVYATEQDIMDKIIERYSLEEIPKEYQRIVGGVRYTMEREGYALQYPYTMAKDISMDTVFVISENLRELAGVEINETSRRYYENGTILPHVLGRVGPIYAEEYDKLKEKGYNMNDILGKEGLELSYENYLKGKDGIIEIEKNIYGDIVDKNVIEKPIPGNTLKLTIDYELQESVNAITKNQKESLNKREKQWGRECSGVSIAVIDLKTGGVLAVSNYPSYDLNDYSSNYNNYITDPETPLFNRALQGLYRPGSVFKVSVAIAGLQAGLITENSTYTCHGYYDYFSQAAWGGSLPGCAGGTAHGTINVEQALQVSCNCFFYDLGRRLGIEQINKTAHSLGLAVKTGLEIPEKQGLLTSPEQRASIGATWQAGDVIQSSIGQLDTVVTTIQLATYAATVANKGVRLNTHIVDSVVTADGGEVVYTTPIEPLSKLENTNNAFNIVEQGMIMASQQGNAKIYLNSLPYQVASKTGTAQVPGDLYNATMIAYGPVDNPQIAIAVIGEKAGNGYNLAESVRDIFLAYDRIREERLNPSKELEKPSGNEASSTPNSQTEVSSQPQSNG